MDNTSYRLQTLQSKYQNLSKKIQKAVDHGDFQKYTTKKRKSLIHRLHRYYEQLQRLLKQKIAFPFIITGLSILSLNTVEAQTFSRESGNNPFSFGSVEYNSSPTFVDIDGDGDLDAFIGQGSTNEGSYGTLNFFRNTGTSTAAVFSAEFGTNPFGFGSVGYSATPTFVDIDGDGDLDAFIGEYDGNLNFFRNTGTSISAVFSAEFGTNPFLDLGMWETIPLLPLQTLMVTGI